MKKLLIICIGVTLMYSCKKEEKQNEHYSISGIHEINFGDQLSDTMSFSVNLLPGGVQENVDLSIEGLPQDLSTTFSKPSGTPTFSSLLTIKREESSTGTYYANLIGISASGARKAYAVKVVVPPLRDIRFDGRNYKVTSAKNYSEIKSVFITSEQDARVGLILPASLPNKAGTYEYRVTGDSPVKGEAQLKFWQGDEYFLPGYRGLNKITLNMDSTGKITKVYLPDIELTSYTGPVVFKTLSINYTK